MPKKPHEKKKPHEQIIENLDEIRAELRDALSVSHNELISSVGNIAEEFNNSLQDFFNSSNLKPLLENVLNNTDTSLGEILKNYLNMEVELITNSGTLQGSITSIEDDFLIFQEKLGYVTLVPFAHIKGITIKGSV